MVISFANNASMLPPVKMKGIQHSRELKRRHFFSGHKTIDDPFEYDEAAQFPEQVLRILKIEVEARR